MGTLADSIKIFFIHVGTQLDALATGTDEKFRHWLNGWRRSVVCPGLCGHSLLTGNFTGNLSKFGRLGTSETPIAGQFQVLSVEFPARDNRELFRPNKEFRLQNSELMAEQNGTRCVSLEIDRVETGWISAIFHRAIRLCRFSSVWYEGKPLRRGTSRTIPRGA
jgi:hypothetical protein